MPTTIAPLGRVRTNPLPGLGLALAVLVVGVGSPVAAAADSDNLDAALQKQAPAIVQYLRDHKYANVGVLKFLVKQGDTLSDNAGPLNLTIANRLEVALTLANPDEKLGIIERASATVFNSSPAQRRRATFRTESGRKELFQIRDYRLAWGDGSPVEPIAFLTGIVEFTDDGLQMKVTVQAFDRNSKEMNPVSTFTASTDFRTLAETGRSFHLPASDAATRGPGEGQLVAQVVNYSKVASEKKESPLVKSPVELKVLYNGRPVEINNGTVRPPSRDDKVSFVLTNKGNERYGVVLKVNGENTLFREENDPFQCHKWVLEPGQEVAIRGFQKDQLTGSASAPDKANEFKVLAPEQLDKDGVYYGKDVGTFDLIVFREARETKGAPEVVPVTVDATAAAIARGSLSPDGKRPGSLDALKGLLKKNDKNTGDQRGANERGIIVPGKDINQPIQYVPFKADPYPVLLAPIRYWQR